MVYRPFKMAIRRLEKNHRFVSKPGSAYNPVIPPPLMATQWQKNTSMITISHCHCHNTQQRLLILLAAPLLSYNSLTGNLRTRLRLRARTYCGQEFFSVQIYTGQLFPISNSHSHSYPIQFSLGFIYLPTHTHTHIHKHTHTQAAVSYNPTVTQLNLAMAIEDVQNCSALARALRVI